MPKRWEIYENQIFDHLKSKYPGYTFKKDDSIDGRFSKVPRQIDIAMRSKVAGSDSLMVIDCKCFETKVDVKDVESFIGMLEDVGAHFGVLVTNKGYTAAAKNRAKIRDVRLDVVAFADIDEYDFNMSICVECEPGVDKPPGVIDWGTDSDTGLVTGRCDWCNTLHVKCPDCATETAINEFEYDSDKECDGGCGAKYRVTREYVGSGMTEDRLEIVRKGKSKK